MRGKTITSSDKAGRTKVEAEVEEEEDEDED